MSTFDESQVNRNEAGRFDFKTSGPPAASLEEPDEARTIRGQDLPRVVASMVIKQRDRIGKSSTVDDVVQNACLEIGKSYGFDRIPLAPIRRVVSRTVTRSQGHSNLGATDRRAMTILTKMRQEQEERLGRPLTNHEQEILAQKVRATWPDARHRPSRNFLQRARLARTERIHREDGTLMEGASPWTGPDTHSSDPSTEVGRVEETLNGPDGARLARRHAWDALAELREADRGGHVPRVLSPTHSLRTAKWARDTIDSYPGGVMGAVDRWEQADEDEGTIALFAPFGDIDEDGRDAVCAMLASYPKIADDLWDAALSSSINR